MIPSEQRNRCAKNVAGKNIPGKELARTSQFKDTDCDWDLYVYRRCRAPDLPLLGLFYGLESEDAITDLKKMEERDREIMIQKKMQEQQDGDRMALVQSLFRENYRHWQRVGYNPKGHFSPLTENRRRGSRDHKMEGKQPVLNLKPRVKRGRSNSDSHVYRFITIHDESSSGGYEGNATEEDYEYEYTEEDVDMSVYGRLPEIIDDNEIVEAILSGGREATPSLLTKIAVLRKQCVDRFWIEEVKFMDDLSEIIKNVIEDPTEKLKIFDMFAAKQDMQRKIDNRRNMFDRMLERLEWDSKETMRKLEEEYASELEKLNALYSSNRYKKPSSELLNLKERLKQLLFQDEIEQARELSLEITEVEKRCKIVNENRMASSKMNAERNLKMKYDRKIELHESRKKYRQSQIRAKAEQKLGKYDRVIQQLDNEIRVARWHNQLRERKMYFQELPSHPMRVRETSYFEETGELYITPPVLRPRYSDRE